MSKKKLEVVELNKKEEKIVLEEKQKPIVSFWRLHRFNIIVAMLLIGLIVFITGSFIFISNIYKNPEPNIEKIFVDTSLDKLNHYITNGAPISEESAKDKFLNTGAFKPSGEVLLLRKYETGKYLIKYYSDGSSLKIMKNNNQITRINPLSDGSYGINDKAEISLKTTTKDVSLVNVKEYPWGTVSYFSDGSADITNSKINMFVRTSSDISETYISNNKVSYLKETKKVGDITLNYYYDGTIEVIKDKVSYLVRKSSDLDITESDVIFKNNNSSKIYKTVSTDNGHVINYYTDGSAIIYDGTKTISVRKSNSIILKDNKIYEIVDNIYVEVSNTISLNNVTYYTNGSATYDYQGKTYYNEENSNLLYDSSGSLSKIETPSEELTKHTNIEDEDIQIFENTAVIKTKDYIAITPSSGVLYDKDGKIKTINSSSITNDTTEFTITNNSSKRVKYRIVIEASPRTNLDMKYLRYQFQIKEKYYSPKEFNNPWPNDSMYNLLDASGTNYILHDDIIEPFDTINVKLMLWTDYETIPNSMQNKYFYGTIKVYSWIEK